MAKTINKCQRHLTPAEILKSLIDEYQISVASLARDIKTGYQSVLFILNGKQKITVQMALRLGKYFGNDPFLWLDAQLSSEIIKISENKKFISVLRSIQKVNKPSTKAKKEAKTIAGKRKSNTLAEKRKKAVKVPGARGAKRGRKSK